MSIKEMLEKIKPFYNLLIILVIVSIFFALGQISAIFDRRTPIKIEYSSTSQTASVAQSISTQASNNGGLATTSDQVIGSKSGKKYYYPWCGTVKRIKSENQVHFNSIEEARAAGFTPGGNCKGLK